MRTQLGHIWMMMMICAATLVLSACQQETMESQFQTQASQLLSNINQNLSVAKFSTAGAQVLGGQSFSTASPTSSWVPYNNYYMQSEPTTELQEAESALAQLPMTAETFQYRIATLFQAAMDTYQAENALATNQFQTIDPTSQQYMAYNGYWRYPTSFNEGFSQFYSGQGSSFLPSYYSNGYVSQAYPYQQ